MHHSLEAVNKESLSMKTACTFMLDLSVNEQQTQQTNPPGWTDTVKLFIILYYTVHELKLLKKEMGELKIVCCFLTTLQNDSQSQEFIQNVDDNHSSHSKLSSMASYAALNCSGQFSVHLSSFPLSQMEKTAPTIYLNKKKQCFLGVFWGGELQSVDWSVQIILPYVP